MPRLRAAPEPERLPEILHASAAIIWEKGYGAARMQDISDAVGLVKGALYHYVPSKERLLYEIIREAFEESAATMRVLVRTQGDPVDVLAELIAAHIETVEERHTAHLVRVRDLRHLPVYLQDELHLIRDECLEMLLGVLQRGRTQGLFVNDLSARLQAISVLHWLQVLTDWRTHAPAVPVTAMSRHQAVAVVTSIATDRAVTRAGGVEGLRARILAGVPLPAAAGVDAVDRVVTKR